MKKIFVCNFIFALIGVIIGGLGYGIADSMIDSQGVYYDNEESAEYGATKTNVQDAIDELYEMANLKLSQCPDGYKCTMN